MKPDKEVIFRQSPSWIYFHNTSNRDVILIRTLWDSREGLSQRQCGGVNQAQRALDMVGYPSDKDFKNMVHARMIPNFPVTLDDI